HKERSEILISMTHQTETTQVRQKYIQDELESSAATKKKILIECADAISGSVDSIIHALKEGKKILLCGNGGSAADAQHMAAELVIRMDPAIKRRAIPAIALTTDSSLLTAGANDIGYDRVFARTVEALGSPGDVLIAITTSGRSESVNNAIRMARSIGMSTIGLLGGDGGGAKDLVDIAVVVPAYSTQRIQEGHITIGHIICSLIEREMYGHNE
ncbi:MAG: SIS domain-containing protein, partial [Bacteroidota bacterium]